MLNFISLDYSEEDKRAVFSGHVPADLACLDGHFPDFPVLPGMSQLHEFVIPSVAMHRPSWNGLVKIQRLKFVRPIIPLDDLELSLLFVDDQVRADFVILRDNETCSSGRLFFLSSDDHN